VTSGDACITSLTAHCDALRHAALRDAIQKLPDYALTLLVNRTWCVPASANTSAYPMPWVGAAPACGVKWEAPSDNFVTDARQVCGSPRTIGLRDSQAGSPFAHASQCTDPRQWCGILPPMHVQGRSQRSLSCERPAHEWIFRSAHFDPFLTPTRYTAAEN
jgi:hypothetical protein